MAVFGGAGKQKQQNDKMWRRRKKKGTVLISTKAFLSTANEGREHAEGPRTKKDEEADKKPREKQKKDNRQRVSKIEMKRTY